MTTRARRPELVIRNVEVLDLGSMDPVPRRADLLIDAGVISEVRPEAATGIEPGPDDIDGGALLAIPGLANTHLHSPGNFMKGAVPNLPLDLYMLFEVPPRMDKPVSAPFARARTLLGAAEMLKQGVTAVHDDAFFLPFVSDSEVDAVMTAYRDSGLRATVALDQPTLPEPDKHAFLRDHLSDDLLAKMYASPRQSADQLLDAYSRFLATWHDRGEGRLRIAASCSAPQRVESSYFDALAALSREAEIPFNMHILETRDQRLFGDRHLGKSLVRYAAERNALDHRSQVIHAVWIDDEDIAVLADAGATVAHNPVCNLRLGSGVMPLRALLDAGVNVGLGTDEANVDDGINSWTNLKIAGLIHQLGEPDYTAWPTPAELLRAATTGGYRSLCLDTPGGTISPGALADLVLLDLNTLAFTPRHDLLRQLVYCEPRQSVAHVLVAGRRVVSDGRLVTIDEAALISEISDLRGELDDYLSRCGEGVEELMPYYEAAYRQGLATSATPTVNHSQPAATHRPVGIS